MVATLVDSDTFAFADGSGGHSCNLGSAPSAGQLDVLCVNSNTVVTTPSGFTAAPTSVGGQGAYIYRRIASGGEGSTVTITTSGDHNTTVVWSRWSNIDAADQADVTAVNGTGGSSTPAHTTATLSATNELVIAFGALHSLGGTPASPSWSAGYTPLASASQGSGGSGVVAFVAYRTDAGTAAESPQVSWSGDPGVADRYMLTLTFTTTAGATNANAENAAATGTANSPAASVSPTAEHAAATGTANDATTAVSSSAEHSAASATAGDPTPAVAPSGEHAAISAVAHDATTTVATGSESAAAIATAHDPQAGIAPSAESATATATADDATTGVAPTAEAATATASAPTASVSVFASAQCATATAAASNATTSSAYRDLDLTFGSLHTRWGMAGPASKWYFGAPTVS